MADDGKKNATNTRSEARERLLRYLDKVGIPDTITSKIDIDTLHESIDDIRKATEVQRNTWALNCIQGYDVPKIAPVGMEILTYFQEDFAEWTVDDFRQLDRHIRRALRSQLVSKGIYLGKLNAPINNRLADLLRMTKLPEWDEDDLLETETLNPTSPAYKQREKLLATRPRNTSPFATPRATTALKREGTAVPRSRPEVKTEQSQDHQDFQQKTTGHSEVRTPSQSPSPAPEPNLLHPGEQPQTIQPQTNWQPTRDLSPQPIPHGGYSDALAYRRLPPAKVEEEPLLPHLVERFIKIWNKDMNYTGEPYDILDDKIRYFMQTCKAIQILPTQFHGVFPHILSKRAQEYYLHNVDPSLPFAETYERLKMHFDTEVNRQQYHTDWSSITFHTVQAANPGKNKTEILQTLLDKLRLCQRALGPSYLTEDQLVTTTMRACRGIPELEYALFAPAQKYEQLCSQLRSSMNTHINRESGNGQFFVDRRYNRRDQGDRYNRRHTGSQQRSRWKNKCYICGKEGCRSTKHPAEEQRKAKELWRRNREVRGEKGSYAAFIAECEGESSADESGESDQAHDHDNAASDGNESYLTTAYLCDEAFRCRMRATDTIEPQQEAHQFTLDRYSEGIFQGIMPDTGAAKVSTAGKGQFLALRREVPSVRLDATRAGEASIRFGGGKSLSSIGTVKVGTPIGLVDLHVVDVPTPFLMCLQDMDRLGVYLNNVANELICNNGQRIPVTRRWGHPWFFLSKIAMTAIYLTEAEMRRLHSRFGHPSVPKLHKLLTRAGHDVKYEAIEMIRKFCHYCQIKGDAPKRFKFTLRDDADFNHEVIVDVMYLEGKPVLHLVDAATSFQAGKFLKSLSAKETWEALKQCWIDTYLGPPDVLTHDAGTNFASAEFRAEAKLAGITCHQVPVEAHWSIGKIERYHAPLRRAFEIIRAETRDAVSNDAALQMALKAVNDTAGQDGLVPTLLVFGAYPRVTTDSPPSPSQQQRAHAISKAMNDLRKKMAERRVRDALNTRNGPDTLKTLPLSLALDSEVRVYREKKGWTGPFKVIAVTDNEVTIDTENGPASFRNTAVQPYYRHPETQPGTHQPIADNDEQPIAEDEQPTPFEYPEPERPRRRGRPVKKPAETQPPVREKRPRGRPRKIADAHMTHKERADHELALKLRREGMITTPGEPFEKSDTTEIESLLATGVLRPVMYNKDEYIGVRVFKSRLVREVKAKMTDAPYEKSRLVVQGYNDAEKTAILTQSPTIQQCSQRLILAIAPALRKMGMEVMIRDITQAYTQSKTPLNRVILAHLPAELKSKYPEGTILRIVKPLYGIAEAGIHWFATYQTHHQEKLGMETSAFDPCLLITKQGTNFGITGLQTDDTINVGTKEFLEMEDLELKKAELKAKPHQILHTDESADFNGCRIQIGKDDIVAVQKGQADKIMVVDIKGEEKKQSYVEQRARGAYIASICQPEACDDWLRLGVDISWQGDDVPG